LYDLEEKYYHLYKTLSTNKDLFRFLKLAQKEDDVIIELANILECEDEVEFITEASKVRVDLIYKEIAIEVEFDIKQPWIGLQQATIYSILLDLPSALIHVLRYVSVGYINVFRKLIRTLRNAIDIKGYIINLNEEKIIVC
jgi:hypothetical protein